MGLLRHWFASTPVSKPKRCTFTLEHAGLTYEDGTAKATVGLQPTSLSIEEQRVAVIGFNGSGKSTLLALLEGALPATTGTVTIAAGERQYNPAHRRDRRDVAQYIGTVRREEIPNSFYQAASIREALATSLKHRHVSPSEASTIIGTLLAHFSLTPVAANPASSLNSEQRHLLAIVSALASSPTAVIADEPTKGLDEIGTNRVATALFGFGSQVILATHDLSLVRNERYAIERVLVLDHQGIAFDGEPQPAVDHYEALIAQRYEATRREAMLH